MNDQDRWTEQLPHFVAGTLDDTGRAALERHLALCTVCQDALRDWETIAAAVREEAATRVVELPKLRIPAAGSRNGQKTDGYMRAIHELPLHISERDISMPATSLAQPYPTSRRRRRAPSITLVAALLLIVLFGGVLLAITQHGDRDSGMIPAGIAASTVSPTPSSTPTPAPASSGDALPDTVQLDGIRYEMQGWNNQGPTTLGMALSYWGWQGDQYDLVPWLKPDPEDKSVAPWQIAYFTNQFTAYRAIYRMGGSMTLMKHLLAAGFPVMLRQSIQPAGEDWMGHYVLLTGYHEEFQQFLTYDSYLGSNELAGRSIPYNMLDERWRHFNRTFIVVYDPAREDDLRAVIGEYVDPVYGAQQALAAARGDAETNQDDEWAWFNMGTSYVALGHYDDAVIVYDQAFDLGLPWRMLWYQFGPYEAYFKTGYYTTLLALADSVLATTDYVEEAYYWQVMACYTQNELGIPPIWTAFDNLLAHNPNFLLAWVDLSPLAAESGHLPVGWEADAGVLFDWVDERPESAPIPIDTLIPTPSPTPEHTLVPDDESHG